MASIRDAAQDIVVTAGHYLKEDREVYNDMKHMWAEQLMNLMGRDVCISLMKQKLGIAWNPEIEEVHMNQAVDQFGLGILFFLACNQEMLVA